MRVGNELKRFREELDMPQEVLGEMANYSQKVISQMENGKRPITPDFLEAITKEFKKAAALKAQVTYQERSEFISVPYLNGVDKHIQTALDCIIEEYEEGISAAHKAKRLCRNKESRNCFTAEELDEFLSLLDQIVDTYTANKMLLTTAAMLFDISINDLEDRHLRKLIRKHYYTDDGGCAARA